MAYSIARISYTETRDGKSECNMQKNYMPTIFFAFNPTITTLPFHWHHPKPGRYFQSENFTLVICEEKKANELCDDIPDVEFSLVSVLECSVGY